MKKMRLRYDREFKISAINELGDRRPLFNILTPDRHWKLVEVASTIDGRAPSIEKS